MTSEPTPTETAPPVFDDIRQRRLTVPEHVVHRGFVYETVLLNLQTGYYHGLDGVGARFFDVSREAPSLGRAAEILAAEYEQPRDRIEADMAAFVGDLLALGLVELVDAAG